MTFWQNIFFALWFFLPAGAANLFPIFAAHTPILKNWNTPLDFQATFRNKRILGTNKTIRGLVVGIIIAIIIASLQKTVYGHWDYVQLISPIDYTKLNPIVLGILMALGALGGDALKSFFKRQLNIAPGERWFFFDQLDYIAGVILLTYFYTPLNLDQYLYLAAVWFVIHILTTITGYSLGLKEKAI